jgi:hypothetical protein
MGVVNYKWHFGDSWEQTPLGRKIAEKLSADGKSKA